MTDIDMSLGMHVYVCVKEFAYVHMCDSWPARLSNCAFSNLENIQNV